MLITDASSPFSTVCIVACFLKTVSSLLHGPMFNRGNEGIIEIRSSVILLPMMLKNRSNDGPRISKIIIFGQQFFTGDE